MMPLPFLLFCFTICLHRPAIVTGNNEYKSSGEIPFKMANFKVFSEGKGPNYVYSDKVMVNGMPWMIEIQNDKNHLSFYLCNEFVAEDYAWSCQVAYQLSIVSPTKRVKKGNLNDYNILHYSKFQCVGYDMFIEFKELMDPKNDLYNETDDTVTFKAHFTTRKPYGMLAICVEDPLRVNDKLVYVNKYLLAAQSEFFQKLFFGQEEAPKFVGNEETPKIQIEGIEKAVENFEQLISIINSPNAVLKDDCVADVQQLANHFEMKFVDIKRWRGEIIFKMPNFKAFVRNNGAKDFYSDSSVSIYGIPWKILIKKNGKAPSLSLYSDDAEKDPSGTYEVASKLLFVFPIVGKTIAREISDFHVYGNDYNRPGGIKFNALKNLMDPRNGVYDKNDDSVTFKAEVVVKKTSTFYADDDLLVNGQKVKVNKYLLAAHSEFFQILFFELKSAEVPEIEMNRIKNVDKFQQLFYFVNSPNAKLNDGCVGTVLQLADFFQLDSIVNRCVNFLMNKSKIAPNYKLMVAQKYHIIGMEKKILEDMKKNDFDLIGEHLSTIQFLMDHVKNEDNEAYQKLKEKLKKSLGVE